MSQVLQLVRQAINAREQEHMNLHTDCICSSFRSAFARREETNFPELNHHRDLRFISSVESLCSMSAITIATHLLAPFSSLTVHPE